MPSSMDRDSLQHHGDNALALARAFGGTRPGRAGGRAATPPTSRCPALLARYPGWLVWPIAVLALVAVLLLAWLARRRGLVSGGRLAAGFLLAAGADRASRRCWPRSSGLALTLIRPAYAELPIDPYRPLWYRLAVLALTAAVVFAWYALLRRRLGPAALAVGGLRLARRCSAWRWPAFAPGGSYLTALPALAGAPARHARRALRGGWGSVLAVAARRRGRGGRAAADRECCSSRRWAWPWPAPARSSPSLLGLALLPVVDLLHPEAGGQRGLDALRARRVGGLPALVALLAAVGLRRDRPERRPVRRRAPGAHPADVRAGHRHQLGPLAERGEQAAAVDRAVRHRLARRRSPTPCRRSATSSCSPARRTAAALPAPQLTVLSDTRAGDARTLRLRLVPQRPVRLATLHVAAERGRSPRRPWPAGRCRRTRWPAARGASASSSTRPPPEGIEVT